MAQCRADSRRSFMVRIEDPRAVDGSRDALVQAVALGGGDIVAFLDSAGYRDGMSNARHSVTAHVSLPDRRILASCSRREKPVRFLWYRSIAVSVLTVGFFGASLAQGVPAATPAAPEAATTIEGPIWRLTELRGLDPIVLRDATRPATAEFKAGRISGFSGCNQFFGPYTLDRDRVVIGPLAGSMMACGEPSMAVENAVHAALAGTFHYVLADHHLTLLSGTEPVLTFQAEPAPTLEGAIWKVTGFNNGRHAVVSPLSGTVISLTFKGGSVEGFAGCNTFRATYTTEADRIVIGPAAVTRMTCGGDGVMQQEREFLSALESTTTWGFIGKLLDMHRADGERVLTAAGN